MGRLAELIENLTSEAFSNTFNMDDFVKLTDYRQREEYAINAGLVLLGRGTARRVYALTPNKVLKIAHDAEQNSKEFSAFETFGKEFAPEVYQHDPDFGWMISERAATWPTDAAFEGVMGFDTAFLAEFEFFIKHGKSPKDPHQLVKVFFQKLPWNVQEPVPSKLGQALLYKFAVLTKAGMDDLDYFGHWGITPDNRLVAIDLGLTHGE
jgi:hypothetical protein